MIYHPARSAQANRFPLIERRHKKRREACGGFPSSSRQLTKINLVSDDPVGVDDFYRHAVDAPRQAPPQPLGLDYKDDNRGLRGVAVGGADSHAYDRWPCQQFILLL